MLYMSTYLFVKGTTKKRSFLENVKKSIEAENQIIFILNGD